MMTRNNLIETGIFLWCVLGPEKTFIKYIEQYEGYDGELYMVHVFDNNHDAVFKQI